MNADTHGNSLRICGGCSAFLLSTDEVTPTVICGKCRAKRPSFGEWADALKDGDRVYLQPGCTKSPMWARAAHVIMERDGDMLDVQPIGCPNGRIKVHIGNVADHDVTPWRGYALY